MRSHPSALPKTRQAKRYGSSRREVLWGACASVFSFGFGLPVLAQPPLSLDRFMSISCRLCATTLTSKTLGADILSILSLEFSNERIDALTRMIETSKDDEFDFRGTTFEPIVGRLVAAWYSGIMPMKASGERMLTYTDAAGWRATGYAKPPSYCGEAFGEWSDKPTFFSEGK